MRELGYILEDGSENVGSALSSSQKPVQNPSQKPSETLSQTQNAVKPMEIVSTGQEVSEVVW